MQIAFLFLLLVASSSWAIPLGPNFYNIRGSFIIDGIDVGVHMSLVKLSTGRFVVFDTIQLTAAVLDEINTLTNNGTLIDAVFATHPFHTTFFPAFYGQYPKAAYYGTPRHLRIQPQIPWAGSTYDCAVRQKWLPEIHMRIARGSEFEAPQPESTNHFSGIHVFHPASRVIHVDDTIMIDEPFNGDMLWHPSILGPGLYHIPQSPTVFAQWVQKLINEWDFDTIAAAHKGIKHGGAKNQLQKLLNDSTVPFDLLIAEFTLAPNQNDLALFQKMQAHESQCIE